MSRANETLTFLEVCRHGSFQAAADALGIATSTITRRMAVLEEHLAAKLFDRSRREPTLTEAGRVYRDRASPLAELLEQAEDAVRNVMQRPAGRLRVAAPAEMIRTTVGEVALAYLERFPDVSLEVVVADDDQVPDGEELHIVVRVSHLPVHPSLIQRVLTHLEMRLAASPAFLERHGPIERPEDLQRTRAIVLGANRGASEFTLIGPDGPRRMSVPLSVFTTSVSLARRCAVAGIGPVGLPRLSSDDLIARGALVEILPEWQLAPVPWVVLFSGVRQLPLRVREFVDLLVGHPSVQRQGHM